MAFFPYLLVIAVFSLAKLFDPVTNFLVGRDVKIPWPGLDQNVLNAAGEPVATTVYNFQWLSSPGSLLLICGFITALVYRVPLGRALRELVATAVKLRWAFLTVAVVLALAYVMNLSGQTITIGQWIAGAGGVLPFLSPIIGWLGVAVTGSDTSSNSLFGVLQATAAKDAGFDQVLLASANSSGGVMGKMVSPQNLAIGAAAVGLAGQEGDLFRRVIGWSLALLLVMCVLVYLQSTDVLSWMVV
jgi:lactate permease